MTSVPSSIAYQDGYNDAVKLFTSDKHINELKEQAIEEVITEIHKHLDFYYDRYVPEDFIELLQKQITKLRGKE